MLLSCWWGETCVKGLDAYGMLTGPDCTFRSVAMGGRDWTSDALHAKASRGAMSDGRAVPQDVVVFHNAKDLRPWMGDSLLFCIVLWNTSRSISLSRRIRVLAELYSGNVVNRSSTLVVERTRCYRACSIALKVLVVSKRSVVRDITVLNLPSTTRLLGSELARAGWLSSLQWPRSRD